MEIVIPGTASLLLFTGAALVLLVTPGPAVLYIVARSIEQESLPASCRTSASIPPRWCMCLAASLGLSALLASSALAFSIVKFCRRRLSDLDRAEEDIRPRRNLSISRRRRQRADMRRSCSATAASSSTCSTRRRRCSSWPLPQFVDVGRGHCSQCRSLSSALSLHAARLHQRRLLCAGGKCRRRLAEAQQDLSQCRALCQRRDVP